MYLLQHLFNNWYRDLAIDKMSAAAVITGLVIMALIITGGIGFFVWKDMQEKGFRFKKYRLQTKVVLVTSAALILVPAVFYFFMEYADLPVKDRFLASLFQAVTREQPDLIQQIFPKWERGDRC